MTNTPLTLADVPFQAVRATLYASDELLAGYDPAVPESFQRTVDFQSYRFFVRSGRAAPTEALASVLEALHDNSITQAMLAFLVKRDRVGAIMGGHREQRSSSLYRSVARLARNLTEKGFLLASGGGPGCMEASHLGATLRGTDDTVLDEAITRLAREPASPPSSDLVAPDGSANIEIVRALHRWTLPAWEIVRQVKNPGESLAIPTWHYGHEPFTPLASHVAKYFQNSVREDGLLAIAAHGIVFTPGKAGTLQEVFQDAAQNYYHSFGDRFSPMVFFDVKYWTETLPVKPLLEALFKGNGKGDEYAQQVLFTSDVDEATEFLEQKAPSRLELTARWESLGMKVALAAAAARSVG